MPTFSPRQRFHHIFVEGGFLDDQACKEMSLPLEGRWGHRGLMFLSAHGWVDRRVDRPEAFYVIKKMIISGACRDYEWL